MPTSSQVTRSRSFATAIARHDLLRQASVELVRTLLPTAKGVRLLGVTVSNFDQAPAGADDKIPRRWSNLPRPDAWPRRGDKLIKLVHIDARDNGRGLVGRAQEYGEPAVGLHCH